jgi:hypothetical protein
MQIFKAGNKIQVTVAQDGNLALVKRVAKQFVTPTAVEQHIINSGKRVNLVKTYMTDESLDSTITVEFRSTHAIEDIEQALAK